MYKLVIIIERQMDLRAFEIIWPQFLERVESLPGLLRETTAQVDEILTGSYTPEFIHELYFESKEAALAAMSSPKGKEAGQFLQKLTQGAVTLLLAEHMQEDIQNLKNYRLKEQADDSKTT
jgi:uncharacterized protein (TIGR02118 family)